MQTSKISNIFVIMMHQIKKFGSRTPQKYQEQMAIKSNSPQLSETPLQLEILPRSQVLIEKFILTDTYVVLLTFKTFSIKFENYIRLFDLDETVQLCHLDSIQSINRFCLDNIIFNTNSNIDINIGKHQNLFQKFQLPSDPISLESENGIIDIQYPTLTAYFQDSAQYQSIFLTNSDVIHLIGNKFQTIQQYCLRINFGKQRTFIRSFQDERIKQVGIDIYDQSTYKQIQVRPSKSLINLNQKCLKQVCEMDSKYVIITLHPPQLQLRQLKKIIHTYRFSLSQFMSLCLMLQKIQLETFLIMVKLKKINNKYEFEFNINEFPASNEISTACLRNGLQNKVNKSISHDLNCFKLEYIPFKLVMYDPIEIKEVEMPADFNLIEVWNILKVENKLMKLILYQICNNFCLPLKLSSIKILLPNFQRIIVYMIAYLIIIKQICKNQQKLIVLDQTFSCWEVFQIFVEENLEEALFWNSDISNYDGVFTHADLIKVLLKLYANAYHNKSSIQQSGPKISVIEEENEYYEDDLPQQKSQKQIPNGLNDEQKLRLVYEMKTISIRQWFHVLNDDAEQQIGLIKGRNDDRLYDACFKITKSGISRLYVVDPETQMLQGIIHQKDILAFLIKGFTQYQNQLFKQSANQIYQHQVPIKSIQSLMNRKKDITTCFQDQTVYQVFYSMMYSHKSYIIPIVNNDMQYVGQICRRDIILIIKNGLFELFSQTVSQLLVFLQEQKKIIPAYQFYCKQFFTMDQTIKEIVENLVLSESSALICLYDNKQIQDIITIADIFRFITNDDV